jgi:hypothetical protein
MITKKAKVILTRKEVESPEKIKIIFSVGIKGEKGSIDYTIEYPKNLPKELPELPKESAE